MTKNVFCTTCGSPWRVWSGQRIGTHKIGCPAVTLPTPLRGFPTVEDIPDPQQEHQTEAAEQYYSGLVQRRSAAIAAAAHQGGDAKQAPGNAPQSGGTAASPDPRRIA